jgi:putative acetyltransferase
VSARLRPAESDDAPAIRAVQLAAFPATAEADLAEALARDGDAVVSLVVETERGIAGHVLLSRMQVTGDGRVFRALGLGPVAVDPRVQGSGLGTALIEGALGIARATKEDMVFVLGEPDYYRRFGFSAEAAAPFASPYAGPYFMALVLRPDLVPPARGEAAYARAFSDLPAD